MQIHTVQDFAGQPLSYARFDLASPFVMVGDVEWGNTVDRIYRRRVVSLQIDRSYDGGGERDFVWHLTSDNIADKNAAFTSNEHGHTTSLRRADGSILWQLAEVLPAGVESWLNGLSIDGLAFLGPVTPYRMGEHISGW